MELSGLGWRLGGAAASAPRVLRRAPPQVLLGAVELELGTAAALAVLAQPAASSISSRRSRGRDITICRTCPGRRPSASPCRGRVGPHLDHVDQPAARSLEAVPPLPVAFRRRTIEISEKSVSRRPAPLSITTSTSAATGATARWPPAKTRPSSPGRGPRAETARQGPEPASVTFDLPTRWADDHRHAGAELQLRPVREGLEALHGDWNADASAKSSLVRTRFPAETFACGVPSRHSAAMRLARLPPCSAFRSGKEHEP